MNQNNQDNEIIKEYMDFGFNEIMAKIFINRGISVDLAKLLYDNPREVFESCLSINDSLTNMANKLLALATTKRKVYIYADYDCDGITSGYILADYLDSISDLDIQLYYPERTDGYGLSMNFCQSIVDEDCTVITIDNGISKLDEISYLKANGIEVIVIDHHMPETDIICDYLNFCVSDLDSDLAKLSCAGVAFLLVYEMNKSLNKDISKYCFPAAIGTIADVMPLTKLNISIIMLGMKYACISADEDMLVKAIQEFTMINPETIAWTVGPMLNACGRMGDTKLGAKLFLQDNKTDLLREINLLNEKRKAITKRAKSDIDKNLYETKYFAGFDASNYPSGIHGILAGYILEKTNKVSYVYGYNKDENILSGSLRSPLDLSLVIDKTSKYIKAFGGHENAAGMSIEVSKIEELAKDIDSKASLLPSGDGLPGDSAANNIDSDITILDISLDNYDLIYSFPYNRDSAPILKLDCKVVDYKISKSGTHVCFTVADIYDNITKIWVWNRASIIKELDITIGDNISMIGGITLDFTYDNKKATFRVNDIIKID